MSFAAACPRCHGPLTFVGEGRAPMGVDAGKKFPLVAVAQEWTCGDCDLHLTLRWREEVSAA